MHSLSISKPLECSSVGFFFFVHLFRYQFLTIEIQLICDEKNETKIERIAKCKRDINVTSYRTLECNYAQIRTIGLNFKNVVYFTYIWIAHRFPYEQLKRWSILSIVNANLKYLYCCSGHRFRQREIAIFHNFYENNIYKWWIHLWR